MDSASSPGHLPQGNPKFAPRDPRLAPVSGRLGRHIAEGDLAGAVILIAEEDRVIHLEARGKADLGAGSPMETDAIFRVHSMTKAITSAAALILAERARLDLDAPVSEYLPQLKNLAVHGSDQSAPPREIPIRDLMRHTSGFTYPLIANGPVERAYRLAGVLDKNSDLGTMVDRLAHIPLTFPPGTGWGYGVSTDVLGRVIEVVTGDTLDHVLAREILLPLGMDDTAFHVPEEKAHRLPASYTKSSSGRLVENDPASLRSSHMDPPTFLSGGGGLLSTARDYFKFLQLLLNGGEFGRVQLLKKESVDLLTTDQLPAGVGPVGFPNQPQHGVGFSLGLSVRIADSHWYPAAQVGDYGWGGAASTHYWVSPKSRQTVIILQQTAPFTYQLEHSLKPLISAALSS